MAQVARLIAARRAKSAGSRLHLRFKTTDTSGALGIKEALGAKIPAAIADVKAVREAYGDEQLGTCTVTQAYGGMRSVKAMTYETSLLDAEEGIRFRGLTLPECQAQLPRAAGGAEPLPEGIFWLLLTGDVPTDAQVHALREEFASRSTLPAEAVAVIDALPTDMHPMTQLNAGVLALQPQSAMAAAYAKGVHKSTYWEYCLDDALTLLAQLPEVAARIYRRSFHDGSMTPSAAGELDMGANYARMMGFEDAEGVGERRARVRSCAGAPVVVALSHQHPHRSMQLLVSRVDSAIWVHNYVYDPARAEAPPNCPPTTRHIPPSTDIWGCRIRSGPAVGLLTDPSEPLSGW